MELPLAIFGLALAIIGTTVVWVRNRKFPRVSCLWIVAILGILFVGGLFLIAPHPNTAPPGPNISDREVSGLTTEIIWPGSVVKDQSFNLTILIIPTPALTASATAEPDQTRVLSQLTPVGTPNVPIAKAFGPKFDAFANAELSASAFDIAPQQQVKQSLDQGQVEFDWTLTPRYTNEQTLSVAVSGVWMPKSGGEPIERPLAGHLLHISVSDAPLSLVPGQLTLSDFLVALISSALNIPWIVELLKKRQETKKEKSDTSSSAIPSAMAKEQKQPKGSSASPSDTQYTPRRRQKKKNQPHN